MALDLSNVKKASSFKEQFTVRAMVIGTIGSIILTASSMFVALKASSLPWPIMFVTLFSMCLLKLMGNTNVNEINVTHTAMSAGSMVAGGLAFTIPGLFILDNNAQIGVLEIGVCTITGTILGLIFTSLLRKHFVEKAAMPYAMGQAAAEVLVVGDEGGKSMGYLGGSFAISGIWTVLRDKLAVVPAMKLVPGLANYGSMTGLWFSPMLIAVGYLIGPLTIGVWFLGWVIGDIGALYLGQTAFGWTDVFASGIKSSLGLGWMVGVGFAITAKEIIPNAKNIFGGMFSKEAGKDAIVPMQWAPIVMLIFAILYIFVLDLPIVAVIITLLGVWLTTAMSSQCVGQSGINPMEVFGIFVMAIAKVACNLEVTQAVYIACIVAVAVLVVLVKAYGGGVFGTEMFPAAQAAAVASVVGGIANVPVFIGGLVASVIVYFITPVFTMLGLGIYLPGYLTLTAVLGGVIRFILDKAAPKFSNARGGIIAAGLLAGEGFLGVIIALGTAISIIKGM